MSSDDQSVPVVVKTDKTRPRRRLGRSLLITCLVVVVGFGGLFGYVNTTFAHGILPNTKINGLPVDGLTAESAQKLVERDVLPMHQVSIKLGDETVEPTMADLGVDYPVREVVTEAYGFGHESSWSSRFISTISALFSHRTYTVKPTVDEGKLQAYVDNLVQSNLKEAANAALVYNKGQVDLQSAQVGQAVDGTQLYQDLLSATSGQIDGYDVEAELAVVVPPVTDEALTAWRDRLVKLVAVGMTLTTPDKSAAATSEQKLSWYTLGNETGQYAITLNEAAVRQTIVTLAKKLDKTPINDQVDDQGVVLVAGQDGYKVDVDATLAQLLPSLQASLATESAGKKPSAIQLATTTTATARQQVRALTATTGESAAPSIDTDAKFAQISLAEQKMYLFENRQLINVFAISSGKSGYETPKGVHKIYTKSVRAWSRTYSLYLPYWNAITADGGYGIHDLPEWPGGYKEPETHLGTPVSHGCIRLGTAQAKYFYAWAPMGMAVVVQ